MPPEMTALVQLIGVPAAIVLILVLRDFYTGKTSAKQEDTITNLLTEINAERKASQERERAQQISINHLSAEVTDLKSKQSFEAGRNTEIEKTIQRERAERATMDDKIRTMETSILDLQKNQRDNQAKIRELETQIDTLNKRIADKDGEIVSLKTAILQLETEKAQLLELNTELRRQVDEHSARVDNLSQLVKLGNEAETPPLPPTLPDTNISNTQAIPDMRDVDDTIHPLPLPSDPPTESKPTADKPAA